jgi:hypothetical protein
MFERNELFLSLTKEKKLRQWLWRENEKKKISEIYENNHQQKISTLFIIII